MTFENRPHRDANLVYYKQLCHQSLLHTNDKFFLSTLVSPSWFSGRPIHCISGLVTHNHPLLTQINWCRDKYLNYHQYFWYS